MKKNKMQLLSCLLALTMLSGCAAHQTQPEATSINQAMLIEKSAQEQESFSFPEKFTGDWTAQEGKLTIHADAQVVAEQGVVLPTATVTPREFTQEDVDTLMRYIRIFSDLSSQIRFAAQKRVLVEIALIKLCRPAMEMNLDSLLDRVRVLEKKIEERPVVQVTEAVSRQSDTAVPEEKTRPKMAAPEDLQKIVAGWKAITGQTTGIFKQMLQKAIPKYNGETGAPVLFVEFQDFLGKSYVDNPEAKKELTEIIERQTGVRAEIQMVVANQHQHTDLAKVTVDQAIRENIHMDVVVEEEPQT